MNFQYRGTSKVIGHLVIVGTLLFVSTGCGSVPSTAESKDLGALWHQRIIDLAQARPNRVYDGVGSLDKYSTPDEVIKQLQKLPIDMMVTVLYFRPKGEGWAQTGKQLDVPVLVSDDLSGTFKNFFTQYAATFIRIHSDEGVTSTYENFLNGNVEIYAIGLRAPADDFVDAQESAAFRILMLSESDLFPADVIRPEQGFSGPESKRHS